MTVRKGIITQEFIFAVVSVIIVFIHRFLFLIKAFAGLLINIFNKSKQIIICKKQNNRERAFGVALVLVYSALCSFLFDVVVLRIVAKIAKIIGFDTLYRYFSPAFSYSIGRFYFFFIFFLIAGCILYLGVKNSIRYRYAIAFFISIAIGSWPLYRFLIGVL